MRILVVKLTSLGDVVHTLPAVTDAVNQLRGCEVNWLVEESFQEIVSWHPSVNKVFTAATRRWRRQPLKFPAELKSLKNQLRSQQYDAIIDAQGLFKSAMLAKCGVGMTIGYDAKSIKEPLASRVYDARIEVSKNNHAVHRIRELFSKALNYKIPDSLDYGISKKQFSVATDEPDYLVFLHATTWSSKQWPVDYWRVLIDLAQSHAYKVMLLWGNEAEYDRAVEISKDKPNAKVCPRMNLDEIASLLSNSKGCVAVDTGIGHLAAALSVPCVNLYGATDSMRTGTKGDFQHHLQAEFTCSPCLKKNCTYRGNSQYVPACFDQLNPKLVWQNITTLISNQ